MFWLQRTIQLQPFPRGLHLVTREIVEAVPELCELEVGLLHIFCRHTSAGLTINENASPEVRTDLRRWLETVIPERFGWDHSYEGPDDMPAHVISSLLGPELTVPVSGGRLSLGTWQGIILGEGRDRGGSRSLTLTLSGRA